MPAKLKPVVPLYKLKRGMKITPKIYFSDAMVSKWKYAGECDRIFGQLMPITAILEVVETSPVNPRGEMWVRRSHVGSGRELRMIVAHSEL